MQFAFSAPWWDWMWNSNRNTPGCMPAWKGLRLASTSIMWKACPTPTPMLLIILQWLDYGLSRCLLFWFSTASSPVTILLCCLWTQSQKKHLNFEREPFSELRQGKESQKCIKSNVSNWVLKVNWKLIKDLVPLIHHVCFRNVCICT